MHILLHLLIIFRVITILPHNGVNFDILIKASLLVVFLKRSERFLLRFVGNLPHELALVYDVHLLTTTQSGRAQMKFSATFRTRKCNSWWLTIVRPTMLAWCLVFTQKPSAELAIRFLRERFFLKYVTNLFLKLNRNCWLLLAPDYPPPPPYNTFQNWFSSFIEYSSTSMAVNSCASFSASMGRGDNVVEFGEVDGELLANMLAFFVAEAKDSPSV